VVLLIVIGALVISYGSSLRTYLRQKDQIQQLEAQIATKEAQKAADAQQKKRLQDPAYIEELARIRLGWVKPGQTPYVVIGADGQPLNGSSGLNVSPPAAKPAPVAWWTKETASLVNADNPPPTPAKTTKPTPSKKITGGLQVNRTNRCP
jgi:hypothetical protein